MASQIWSTLKKRFAKPLIGLGAVSVSTTLAACYGPPPDYMNEQQNNEEFCAKVLENGCKDETGNFPYQCSNYCNFLRDKKAKGDNSVVIPDCCPE